MAPWALFWVMLGVHLLVSVVPGGSHLGCNRWLQGHRQSTASWTWVISAIVLVWRHLPGSWWHWEQIIEGKSNYQGKEKSWVLFVIPLKRTRSIVCLRWHWGSGEGLPSQSEEPWSVISHVCPGLHQHFTVTITLHHTANSQRCIALFSSCHW